MINYSESIYLIQKLKVKCSNYSDEDLIDECSHFLVLYRCQEVDDIIKRYFKTAKLTKAGRDAMVNFYVLCQLKDSVRV